MSNISAKAQIAKTAIIHEDVTIEAGVVIHDYAVIYPETILKSGCEIGEHCVVGRYPKTPGSTSRPLKNEYKSAVIGENSILCPGAIVYAGTKIGNNTLLGDYCSFREDCEVGEFCLIGRNVSVNYEASIGHHTKIMDNSIITGNIKIGNHVFISVLVSTSNDNTMGREDYNIDHVYGAVIEDYVTVGAAANILPHVTIGKNSIVGASALVTKDVPANKVVMGIPARIVRDV
ncbi:MAG: transferase [Oscillospiraceae bacterium]